MALLDLSLVTQTLINLIRESFNVSHAWSGSPPSILPDPPNKLTGDALGLYLYHICEDAYFKNLPAPGNETQPVRYVSMALNLYYQLSANTAADSGSGAFLEQQMMGVAIKAMHDYPFINDGTTINGTKLFPAPLQGSNNRMKIVLQPVLPNDAVNFWTAGTSPLKLAAYYQISVILLEPEESRSRSGRVLAYGVYTFLEGAPRLDNSENTLSFILPTESEPREVILRPAQVPVDDKITFTGTGLKGESTSLFLKNIRWDDPVEVDLAWAVAATDNSLSSVVRDTASGEDVLPGVYSAFVKVIRRRMLSSGEVREFEHYSNDCPFTITPRIDNISTPDSNNVVTVKGYIFRHTGLTTKAVKVYLGEVQLNWQPPPNPLNPSEFTVVDPPSGETLPVLQFRLPAGLASGQIIPLRIFVNGAESPPNWITAP